MLNKKYRQIILNLKYPFFHSPFRVASTTTIPTTHLYLVNSTFSKLITLFEEKFYNS